MAEQAPSFRGVNKDSFDYHFGRLYQRLDGIDQHLERHNGQIGDFAKALEGNNQKIAQLPCGAHQEAIINLRESESSNRKFKDKVLLALISGAIGSAVTVLGFILAQKIA